MTQARTYSPNVRVGNWIEDLVLKEDMLKDFLEQKGRGELTLQKVGTLRDNIMKSVELSVTLGMVRFGDTVMLVNPGREEPDQRDPCALSILTDISNIRPPPQQTDNQSLQAPCLVGGARSLQPCVRNAFVIDSVDGTPKGDMLLYDQSFCLRTTAGYAGGLYLASDVKSFQKCAPKSRLQEVNLVEELNFLCHWKLKYIDPQERLEHEGFPVSANSRVLISHCKTNQCLSLMENHILWTPFGKEYEITAQTRLDSHKAEQDGNHWIFSTSDPGNHGHTLFQTQQANQITEETQSDPQPVSDPTPDH
ncbi:cilia- and flagella-associated protein 161 [Clupea harengus]|uniref:Cilia- and flagella-associated protein 161 n=1 Tax=Clupea harengus TaxID=7950 RepID=A0A6P3VL73_CLUHA|nr:cilia- and flagella-associated protein 161 [Clupea harengus]